MTQNFRDLFAADDVRALGANLEHIQAQLESLGATSAQKPIGHIFVPRKDAGVALPAGKATIDFGSGRLSHEDLGVVADDLATVNDLVDDSPRTPQLENVIFHSDTLTSVSVGNDGQENYLQNVPIPESNFESVTVDMGYPGELTVMASTQQLPIGLGAVTVNGQRHGELSGTLDSFNGVPVAPFSLWDDHGATYGKIPVYVAYYDSTTVTCENTSGNGNGLEVEIQAKEALGSPSSTWRTIGSDTVPDGEHSVFNITERHKLLRTRIKNTTGGQTVSASVDLNMANP